MKKIKYLTAGMLSVAALFADSTDSLGQRRVNTHFLPYSSVSFGVGSSHYYGDLAGYRQFIKATYIMPRWNVGIGYTRQFTPKFAARATFTWARIAGDDYTFNKNNIVENLPQYVRNLHFRNDLKEFAITGVYNFIPDGRTSEERAKFTPYLFGGIALVAHSPEARTPYDPNTTEAQQWVKLQPLHTEGQGQPGYDKPYSLVTAAIPVGLGVRYKLNENFNLAFEVGFRYTFTDYLDDVGGSYAAKDALTGLAAQMADRRQEVYAARPKSHPNRYQPLVDLYQNGDPGQQAQISNELQGNVVRGADGKLNDGYLLTSFQIHYIIPSKIKCPPIR